MKTELLSAASQEHLERAADILRTGGLVAFPTDTVYGLGARVFDSTAVMRLYEAKRRPPDKAIPVLLGSLDQLEVVVRSPSASALKLAKRFWPGPLTIVMPKQPEIPEAVASETVGIRVPDHPVARALLAIAGPMAVTSANLSGFASPVTASQVLGQLDGRIELVLDGGVAPGGLPSTVVDCTKPHLVILREGPLSLEQLSAALE